MLRLQRKKDIRSVTVKCGGLMLVLTNVCTDVGMGYTDLPASSLLCAHITNSAMKRDVLKSSQTQPAGKSRSLTAAHHFAKGGYEMGFAGNNTVRGFTPIR